jgi:hypothetical protein
VIRQASALILCAAALAAAPSAGAIDIQQIDVRFQEDRYIVDLRAHLDAPSAAVGQVLTDFESYPELDPRILEVRLEDGAGTDRAQPRLVTRVRVCLGSFICRTVERVELIDQQPGLLIASAVPAESDVRFGSTHSSWRTDTTGTEITYRLEMVPDFWIPPLIGRRLMLKTLREGTVSLFTNVEHKAREKQ